MVKLFKKIKENHPAFQTSGIRGQDTVKILRSQSAILDALQPVRNKITLVHPNEILLEYPEGKLVINATKTIMHYFSHKISEWKKNNFYQK